MASYRYSAYLSYSHSDRTWARWLHRALESYRVPRKLAQRYGEDRNIPRRLGAVFRDRDDLSSAADLSEELRKALRASESLIVLCSPRAAASRWVNEEIRFFRSINRASRIFCVVVDGELASAHGVPNCFPPALYESTEGGASSLIEPLAVDPRPEADGKQLAKLKVIAGLLDIRLDDLRSRDDARTRRNRLGLAGAALVACCLMFFSFTARQAEMRERQNAEQLASFIVDLGEDLKAEIDLESLRRISSRAMSYLRDIDPRRLNPETGIKVAIALRQFGEASEGQAKFVDAEAAFAQSKDILTQLREEHPTDSNILFELGQAEYFLARLFYFSFRESEAVTHAKEHAAIATRLLMSDPDNLRYQIDHSNALVGLLAMQISAGKPYPADILLTADAAVAAAKRPIAKNPDDPDTIDNLSGALAWAADAHLRACNLDEALVYREDALNMAEKSLAYAPTDRSRSEAVANAHSGIANVRAQLGELGLAETHLRASTQLFKELSLKDKSNERIRQELAWKQTYLSRALLRNQKNQEASELLAEVSDMLYSLQRKEIEEVPLALETEFQITSAIHSLQTGDLQASRNTLERMIDLMGNSEDRVVSSDYDRLTEALYMLSFHTPGTPKNLPEVATQSNDGLRNCGGALRNARLALLHKQHSLALDELQYLKSKGYRGQDAAELCSAIPGCDL